MASSAELDQYIAEAKIRRKLHLYSRGCDRGDSELLRTLYHPDARDEHGIFSGTGSEFADFVMEFIKAADSVMHYITNAIVDVEGSAARVESSFFVPCIGMQNEQGEKMDVLLGGRYLDRFEDRGDGDWKIAARQVVYDWFTRAPLSGHWNEPIAQQWDVRGRKDRSDAVYGFLTQTASL